MKHCIRLSLILPLVAVALSACSNKQEDLKSPCVGAEQSPCDRRAPSEQPLV